MGSNHEEALLHSAQNTHVAPERKGMRSTAKTVVIAVTILAAVPLMLLRPAEARAATGTLTVGMKVIIGQHSCSLGFFGFNDREDRLAVTSGHCADDADQKVYAKNGVQIGTVVSHLDDSDDPTTPIVRSRGYTVIRLFDDFSLDVFFTAIGTARTGDGVAKYGSRTGKTYGRITHTHYDKDRPDLSTLVGNVIILSGDSGSPWYSHGPTLIGMSASGSYEDGDGADDGDSQAQPIRSVVTLIRENASIWGQGFKVWITAGAGIPVTQSS